jgi:hypothetical protein
VLMIVLTIIALFSWVGGTALVKMKPEKFRHTSLWDPVANLVRLSLWVFGIVVIVYKCMATAIDVSCYETKAIDTEAKFKYVLLITRNITQICLVVIQSISTFVLRKIEVPKKGYVKYFLSFISLQNAVYWMFNAFLQGYGIRINHHEIVNNSTVLVKNCFWSSNLETKILQPIIGVYRPIIQNFYLLTICLTTIFTSSERYSAREFPDDTNRRTVENRKCPRINSAIATAFTSMAFIPLAVLCWLKYNNGSVKHLRKEWEVNWCILNLIFISVILRGFHILRKTSPLPLPRHSRTLTRENLLFIILSSGIFAYETVEVFDSFSFQWSLLLITKCILSMIQSYLQTVFIVCLNRTDIYVLKSVRALVISLMIGNLVISLYVNFVAVLPKFESDVSVLGTSWSAVRLVLMYIIGFYRLLSFLYLYRMFRFASVR